MNEALERVGIVEAGGLAGGSILLIVLLFGVMNVSTGRGGRARPGPVCGTGDSSLGTMDDFMSWETPEYNYALRFTFRHHRSSRSTISRS